jgi:pseudaminic acid synthase
MITTDRVFIVAELSANHGGKLKTAIESIRAIARTGADAVKLQTYTADTMTIDCKSRDFLIAQGTPWDGKYLYDLYKETCTPWEWHEELFRVAKEEGLICFSTPFDKTAVDFLESLGNPIYKIASFEITDISLIECVASKQKPVIISTGIAKKIDILRAIQACMHQWNDWITLLKCTSAYPAPIKEANLLTMRNMAKKFKVRVGLSDHTLGLLSPVIAVSLGATIIEKHFIIDRAMGGADASFSLNEAEFAAMVQSVRETELALGKVTYSLTKGQKKSRDLSRSLYVVADAKAGDVITEDIVRSIRPGFGEHPMYLPLILGQKLVDDVKKGMRFNANMTQPY